MKITRSFLGFLLTADVTLLNTGIHILLTGGYQSHIGSLSAARPRENPRTLTFPGHREQAVSEQWAAALAHRLNAPAAVVCGIHYDDLSREDLARLLRLLDEMLEEVLSSLPAPIG